MDKSEKEILYQLIDDAKLSYKEDHISVSFDLDSELQSDDINSEEYSMEFEDSVSSLSSGKTNDK
jgi:hypothetical protein